MFWSLLSHCCLWNRFVSLWGKQKRWGPLTEGSLGLSCPCINSLLSVGHLGMVWLKKNPNYPHCGMEDTETETLKDKVESTLSLLSGNAYHQMLPPLRYLRTLMSPLPIMSLYSNETWLLFLVAVNKNQAVILSPVLSWVEFILYTPIFLVVPYLYLKPWPGLR